jgi:hypothetical protein
MTDLSVVGVIPLYSARFIEGGRRSEALRRYTLSRSRAA